jgi:hypothetical protein
MSGPAFFVQTLGCAFGCLQPNEIAAGRDLIGEFVGRLLPESPVRPTLVVFPASSLNDLPGFGQGCKPVGIQAFCPKSSVEGFHESVVYGLARTRECDAHPLLISP